MWRLWWADIAKSLLIFLLVMQPVDWSLEVNDGSNTFCIFSHIWAASWSPVIILWYSATFWLKIPRKEWKSCNLCSEIRSKLTFMKLIHTIIFLPCLKQTLPQSGINMSGFVTSINFHLSKNYGLVQSLLILLTMETSKEASSKIVKAQEQSLYSF